MVSEKNYQSNEDGLKIRIDSQDAKLSAALSSNNQAELEKIIGERLEAKFAKKEKIQKLTDADPNDVEAQKEIEKEISKCLIESNYQAALENRPEFFGKVSMLYIDTKVNNYPVQAFVDSGAQCTVISKECAERCSIMHLLDTRFKGTATGVGECKILGRVHLADLQLIQPDGKTHLLQCSFSVLENNKIDLLFGLDNLKRHDCCIDLAAWRLHFYKNEFSVPFLADGAIKYNKSLK